MDSPADSVREKLMSNEVPKKSIHEATQEFGHLRLLLSNFLFNEESNSVIVLGSPGAGKTTFIVAALESLELTKMKRSPKIIKLNGILSKDLKTAVLSISRSLKLEAEAEGLIGDGTNFEDRLADVLQFLRTSLTRKARTRPVLIILDRVDLFCEHRGQALLYNLFDIVQSKESPLCVIGVTSRVDILELLEKRVKSRFSHRILHLGPLPFTRYFQFAKKLFDVDVESNSDVLWNASVANALSTNTVERIFKNIYRYDNTVSALINFICTLLMSCEEKELSTDLFTSVYTDLYSSSTLMQGLNLSHPEMFIMLAIHRSTKNGNAAFNFPNLYEIIARPASETSQLRKEDLFVAFNYLVAQELVTPVDKKSASVDNRFYKSEVTSKDFLQLFKSYPNLPSAFQNLI